MKNSTLKRSPLQLNAWFHNQLKGKAKMIEMNARIIASSDTVTGRAMQLAGQIEMKVIELRKELKTRIDK